MSKNHSCPNLASVAAGLALAVGTLTSWGTSTSCRAQSAAPDVLLGTRSNPAAPAINPLLKGAQFNFFSTPIKQRLNNQALLEDWKSAHIGALRYPGGT